MRGPVLEPVVEREVGGLRTIVRSPLWVGRMGVTKATSTPHVR